MDTTYHLFAARAANNTYEFYPKVIQQVLREKYKLVLAWWAVLAESVRHDWRLGFQ